MGQLILSILIYLTVCPSLLIAGTTAATGRAEFQNMYAKDQKDSPSLFGTAPVYHIIPEENTITFAGDYRYYDATVAGPGVDISSNRKGLSERLDMSGWAASPYIAFSTHHFGFGFAGEKGKRMAHYLRQAESSGGYEEHLGVANYSGVGLNVFWTPPNGLLPKYAVPTFIAGGKVLNVVEESSGELFNQYAAVTNAKYQYSVQNYEAGCNVRLGLVKHFTVIPWVDYTYFGFSKPKSSTGATSSDSSVVDDGLLFWKSAPPLTYGIDFAIMLWGIDLHMGGLIGVLGTLDKGSARIQDHSNTVSISFSTKGG